MPDADHEQPLVTAVVATRDRPQMLREAVAAIAAQDYPGVIETVVVFDQSPPDLTLASDDSRRPVIVTENRRTPGLAGARNSGIDRASGDFVAFCDDDDLWFPVKIRLQMAALVDAGASFVTGDIQVEYQERTHQRRLGQRVVPLEALLRDRHTELHPSTFLVRREDIIEGGQIGPVGEDVPGGFGEDYDLLLRAARVRPLRHVETPIATVRWGTQSFFFQRWRTMADGLAWILRRFPEFESDPKGSARIRGQIAFALAALNDREEAFRWCRTALRRNPLEPRTALAWLVAMRLVSANRVMKTLHRFGRGI